MTPLTREQVEQMLMGLVQDKVSGVVVAQLIDHDAALRAESGGRLLALIDLKTQVDTLTAEQVLEDHKKFFTCIVAAGEAVGRQWVVREATHLLARLEEKG